jgi:putative protein-disulfide isomerase
MPVWSDGSSQRATIWESFVADVILVTDPMCSWCWGMARDVEAARRALAGEFDFDLIMGGINLGSSRGVSELARARLAGVWHNVAEVTGVAFGPGLPAGDFVYDSTNACLAIEAVRRLSGHAPFELLHRLQRRFFVASEDITRFAVLAEEVAALGIDAADFRAIWRAPATRQRVLAGFVAARSHGTAALPSVLLERDGRRRLVAGGYLDAATLVATLRGWVAPVR